jgi:fumarate reductase flavoprotein subunit
MPHPIEYDIAIVGGGLAGLAAGTRAAELGSRVVVLEAGSSERYACNSRFSMGIFHLAFTPLTAPPNEIAAKMRAATGREADDQLVDVVSNNAERSIDWLAKAGIRFINGGKFEWMNRMLTPPALLRPGLHWEGRGGDTMIFRLGERFRSLGGQLVLGAEAKGLIIDGEDCNGVVASVSGDNREFHAQSVILADGGFQGNERLVKEFITHKPEALCMRGAGTGKGAGLMMARMAGAKLVDLPWFYGHVQCREVLDGAALWPYPILDILTAAAIVVDSSGKRFADEGRGGVFMANAIARLEDPAGAVVIFDDAIWHDEGTQYLVPPNPNALNAGAKLYSSPTLEGLAAELGLPGDAVRSEVEQHNAFLTSRTNLAVPRTLPTNTNLKPIGKAPFYAFRLAAGITYTMGGIAIDENCGVLREDGSTIEGLFAAGATSGGIEGGAFAGYTGGLSKALVLGLIAGEAASTRAIKLRPMV